MRNQLYILHYTADRDLLKIYHKDKGEVKIATFLYCSLDGDQVFSRKRVIEKKFVSALGVDFDSNKWLTETPGPPYIYATVGMLRYTSDGGGT